MCRSIVAESLGTCMLTCSEIKKFTRAYLYPTVMCSPCDSVTSKLISGLIVDDFVAKGTPVNFMWEKVICKQLQVVDLDKRECSINLGLSSRNRYYCF